MAEGQSQPGKKGSEMKASLQCLQGGGQCHLLGQARLMNNWGLRRFPLDMFNGVCLAYEIKIILPA